MKFSLILNRIKPLLSKSILIPLFLIALVLFIGLRGGQNKNLIKTADTTRKTIESQITASGSVKSEEQAPLKFLVSGKLAWLNVKEGDKVQKGQAIAGIENERYNAALRQAKQDFNNAAAVLSQVYDDLKKFSPPENFDQKIKRTAAETIQNKAYDSIRAAEEDLAHTVMLSPVAGTITSLSVTDGETVIAGVEIGQVADLDQKRFSAEVDETEIGKIKSDMDAKIKLDAFEGKSLDSKITKIATKSTVTSTGSTAYLVTFDIPPDEQYRLGMNGEAAIITDHADDAIVIPIDAIVDDKYVWVKNGNNYEKKEIELGVQSDTEAQIKSGLMDNSKVLINGFDEINKKNLFQKILGIFR